MKYEIRNEIANSDRESLRKYSDIVAHLLYHRGLKNESEAEKFLHPDYNDSFDPMLLAGISEGSDRILKAIKDNERICVYSDYDADGIPGAVVLSDFLKKIGFENFFSYIPHRNREGFGLNIGAIDKIKENKADVIITIDCGISDVKQVSYATESGIDVIITDHHEPNGHELNALAVIDPKRPDCLYPDKNICGAGVIFKFVQALIQKGDFDIPDGWEKWLLDMVGISTISDMVPLIGENRIFAYYGLMVMHKSQRKGLQKLVNKNRLKQADITEDDVGFTIAPRINAASRMDEPEMAYRMLFTDDDEEADSLVKHLDKINNERKGYVAAMVKEIKKMIEEDGEEREIVVHGNPNWKPSLLGLAASSIVETYHKPVFLWGRGEGDDLKGSCRSNGNVNLVEMMSAVEDGIISGFGGHEMAGGFVVLDDGVHSLRQALEEAYKKTKHSDDEKSVIVDYVLSLKDISWNLFNDIHQLSPFGIGNLKPAFLLKNILIDDVILFGATGAHLKLIFKVNEKKDITAIKFFSGDDPNFSKLEKGMSVNLIANLEKSTFGYYPELRLRIIDLEIV